MGVESGVYAHQGLLDMLRSDEALEFYTWYALQLEQEGNLTAKRDGMSDREKGLDLVRQMVAHVVNADVFTVTPELCEVISGACATLPPEPLQEDDPFCDNGFVYLERPHVVPLVDLLEGRPDDAIDGKPTRDLAIWGWAWKIRPIVHGFFGSGPQTKPGVAYNDYQRINGVLAPVDRGGWPFTESWSIDTDKHDTSVHPAKAHGRRWLLAFWRLVKQRIIMPTEVRAPRHVRRATAKAGKEISTVKVIRLRRLDRRKSTPADEPQHVEWSHRWCVEGHWREQWYPTKGRHERIWIHPYIKGPDDKPLVVKDTVFHVVR